MLNVLHTVDFHQFALFLVVFHKRHGLGEEVLHAGLDGGGGVVGALLDFGAFENAFLHLFHLHLQVDDFGDVEVVEEAFVVEHLGLFDGARHAVEDKALGVSVFLDMVAQHAESDVVGTEVATVDDFLRLQAQRGLVGDLVTEQVAGGDVFKLEFFGHLLGLGAFSAAWGTEHDDVGLFHIVFACYKPHTALRLCGVIKILSLRDCLRIILR